MRHEAFGERGLTWVDRWGTHLSRRPVIGIINQFTRPHVLDLGCGYRADLLRHLESRIGRGMGVDVRIASDIPSSPTLTFMEQPIDRALHTLKDQRFDVILMISVLEHLWRPRFVLTGCHRLLNPGGALIINVPNWMGKRALEFSAFRLGLSPALEMNDHKMYYDKRDLWPLLVRAAFKPQHIHMRYHKLGLNLFAVARKLDVS